MHVLLFSCVYREVAKVPSVPTYECIHNISFYLFKIKSIVTLLLRDGVKLTSLSHFSTVAT